MSSNTQTVAESYPVNGGDGPYSYARNSLFQRAAISTAKTVIDDAIAEKLDLEKLRSASESVFRIADMGCSVGPNTFIAAENIINAVQHKYQSQGLASHIPEFQVFFSDHASNDFNTLFTSLPPERPYFAAGVPGSFYGRLFPESSLHFVHSSYALQFLSEVPAELLNKNSPAWNKGRIHYTGAPDDVARAYTAQFSKDMSTFLDARAEEVTVGGMMLVIIPAIPDGIPHSCLPAGVPYDLLGLSLMDMAKEGLISEAEVDSFNLPLYGTSAREMTELVAKNGRFRIERMEMTTLRSIMDGRPISGQLIMMHLRAGMSGIISKHFGAKIIDELFHRFNKKTQEFSDRLESMYDKESQIFIVLKRV